MNCEKKKAMIYPYGLEFAPVVRHSSLMQNYIPHKIVSPNGWAYSGKDVAIADRGDEIGILVTNEFDTALDECDTLIIADCKANEKFKPIILDRVYSAISKKKNIVNTYNFSNEEIDIIKIKCDEECVEFKNLSNPKIEDISLLNNKNLKHQEFSTPIIFVAGMLEGCCKFEVQLSLMENFLKRGYKVSHVGTRNYCELLGIHSFPQFMFSTNISDTKKVLLFNHYIKHIEITEKPDIIIIGIPGEIMPFYNEFRENYGIMAYLVSQAVRPDYAILNILFDNIELSYLERLSLSTRYRLGFNIDIFNITNIQFDKNNSEEMKRKIFNYLDSNFVEEVKQKNKMSPVYNSLNSSDCDEIVNSIINSLTSGEMLVQ